MPILDVFDDDGRPIANASFIVWATMLVPAGRADERWNLHMAAQAANEALAFGGDAIMIDRATFVQLYDTGRASVERDSERRQRDGEQVGDLLLIIRALSRERPTQASLCKAIRLHVLDMKARDQGSAAHGVQAARSLGRVLTGSTAMGGASPAAARPAAWRRRRPRLVPIASAG